MNTNEAADVGLAAFQRVRDGWKAGITADSLIEFAQPTRVEPIVLVAANAIHLDETPDVLQSLLNMFTGYYLQGVARLATVNNAYVMKQLDKLSPNRSLVDNALNSPGWELLKMEDFQAPRLPFFGGLGVRPALEAELKDSELDKLGKVIVNQQKELDALKAAEKENEERAAHNGSNQSKETITSVKDLTDLSVGKLISVEISDGEHKATVPVNVRLLASSIPTQTLVHILSVDSQDYSATERYHAWRSGRIEFVKDLVLCQDLIDARRKAMMSDKDGVYLQMQKRASHNAMSTMLSGRPSVATASNMVVMTTADQQELELKLGGQLHDFHTRERMFAPTTMMIMAIIDPHYARVTFYHRSIPHPTEVSLRDIKASNKKSGPDVNDIMRAYQIGSAPQL